MEGPNSLDEPAKAVVQPHIHRLRYDFESLLWVALWWAMTSETKTKELEEQINRTIMSWETGTIREIRTAKWNLMSTSEKSSIPLTPNFRPWRWWFVDWLTLCAKGEELVDDHINQLREIEALQDGGTPEETLLPDPLDLETLNGTITRDAIVAVLKRRDVVKSFSSFDH